MTLDEAIEHLRHSIEHNNWSCESCKREHIQLLGWLLELRGLREEVRERASGHEPVATRPPGTTTF